jgi:phosphoribosylanthranilate isomerase
MGYHVRVKICGVTRPEDAVAAALAGADAIGLNFYPKSPRFVDDARASAILDVLPPFVEAIGVFAGESPPAILPCVQRLPRIRAVQLHGTRLEPGRVLPCLVIIAVQVGGVDSLGEVQAYLAKCQSAGQRPAAVLVDGNVPGHFGGTGQTAPWRLAAEFRPGVPLILAGGLTPENVADAIRTVRPYAVDVASGVESAPGRKDIDQIRRFIANARSAAAGLPD